MLRRNYTKTEIPEDGISVRLRASESKLVCDLTLILLMWRIWRAPNNASRWHMGFNSAFTGTFTMQCIKLVSINSTTCSHRNYPLPKKKNLDC
jgi:hypothetical protein